MFPLMTDTCKSYTLFHLALAVVDPLDDSLPHPERVEEFITVPLPFPQPEEITSLDMALLPALAA